jgi:class 3 adenylate cyclase/tetratricopeptide (TPR) repeat protein
VALCPSCGEENPDEFRLCRYCGAPLHDTSEPQREERKVVTVLFCDLVEFTASSDEADPEDVRARIRPYHSRLREEIEGFGGTVEKFIGDAVMAVFGAPTAHEDDPERAVRAGLTILEAIADLNEQDPGLELQVRVGIESGEAVVALGSHPETGEGIVTGDVVNTASRLQGAAPINGVVVGEGTHAATKTTFDYEALEPVSLKGKASATPIFHATAARARFGTDVTRALTTPLVGRDLECRLLTGILERSLRDDSVQLVTIVGEPGVGKTRLVAELVEFVDARPELIRWRQGRCLPYGDAITFWALGEIVKAEAGILETDDPQEAASKIDAVVPDAQPDAPWLRRRLRPLVGVEGPEAAREENFAAWRAFLELLAEDGPFVFVIEDLHWADEALLAFLEHLAEYAEGVPMLLVATARPELFDKSPGLAQSARNSHRIDLASLPEADMARLISNLLEQAVLPADVQQAILNRSGGNPLYAEEYVRLLKDRGVLRKRGPSWSVDQEAETPLPSGVQGLIAARLDTLSSDSKSLLQDASVVGKVFWLGAVARMSEQGPRVVEETLHRLSRKELVRPARVSSMEGEAEYAFCHALVREVCYGQIPRAQRAERHRRAAAWIEEVASVRLEDHAEILAAHYSTALDLAAASKDPNTADLRDKAARYLTLAGNRAMGMDVEVAERHYAGALDMLTEGHPDRPDVLARHGEALLQRGRFPEAAKAFERAIELFRGRGDVKAAAITMGRQRVALVHLNDPRFRAVSAEAVAMLEPLGPSPELVQVLTAEASASYVSGDDLRTIALADRAIALADELALPEPVEALQLRGPARALHGDPEGVHDVRRALAAAQGQGLGREVAAEYNTLAYVLAPIEGPSASLSELREGVAFAQRRGIEELGWVLKDAILDALHDLGSYDDATALANELVPLLERAEAIRSLIYVRGTLASVLARSGNDADASPLAEWAAEHARDSGLAEQIAHSLPILAGVRLALGGRATAVSALSELEATPKVREEFEYVRHLAGAVATAVAAGERDLATRMTQDVEPTWPWHEHALVSSRALLAAHQGEHAEAGQLFADAAMRWGRFEMPWEQAQALLGQGRCLLTLGLAPEATAAIRQARELLATLRAEPAVRESDALLEQAAPAAS